MQLREVRIQVFYSRQPFQPFFPTTDITGTTPVTEVAMFTGASGTFEMWNREVFSSVTKDDTIELTFEQTYEIF